MSKVWVYATSSDPVVHKLYDEDETLELYGEDMMEDNGTQIEEELLRRYQKNISEFWAIQDELDQILNEKRK